MRQSQSWAKRICRHRLLYRWQVMEEGFGDGIDVDNFLSAWKGGGWVRTPARTCRLLMRNDTDNRGRAGPGLSPVWTPFCRFINHLSCPLGLKRNCSHRGPLFTSLVEGQVGHDTVRWGEDLSGEAATPPGGNRSSRVSCIRYRNYTHDSCLFYISNCKWSHMSWERERVGEWVITDFSLDLVWDSRK